MSGQSMAGPGPGSWIELAHLRAGHPDRLAYAFLNADGSTSAELCYGDLDRRARAIAARLQTLEMTGERALLLHRPGLDFVSAFFGCLYARVIAVPTFPPRSPTHRRLVDRLRAVVGDAGPAIALGTRGQQETLEACLAAAGSGEPMRYLATDETPDELAASWDPPRLAATQAACLQYTSGSTGSPKGVVLSHGNLLSNSEAIRRAFRHDRDSVCVSWLPPYHDMGLVGGILQPMYAGFPVYLMDPGSFLRRPAAWLEAITRCRATSSGGPNFAYEWCIERVSEQDKASLDLGSWRIAFNGAETVNHETLERFTDAFSGCGFRSSAHFPCYGLAEHTLFVSGGPVDDPAESIRLKRHSLIQGRVEVLDAAVREDSAGAMKQSRYKTVVSCGKPAGAARVAIMDTDRLVSCPEDVVGEVWVSGDGVARGYWGHRDSPAFAKRESDTWLRTGDLGFLHDAELYVVGRIKDQLKVRGLSYDPLDIEQTAAQAHPALAGAPGAAFTTSVRRQQMPVLAQELRRDRGKVDLDAVIEAVLEAISRAQELALHAVLLIAPGRCPRTPGGKIQRHAAKTLFENDGFEPLAEWRREPAPRRSNGAGIETDGLDVSLRGWLVDRLAEVVEIPPESIDSRESFMRYGLDSLSAVRIGLDVEEKTGIELPETVFLDYPTIDGFVEFLTRQLAGRET